MSSSSSISSNLQCDAFAFSIIVNVRIEIGFVESIVKLNAMNRVIIWVIIVSLFLNLYNIK